MEQYVGSQKLSPSHCSGGYSMIPSPHTAWSVVVVVGTGQLGPLPGVGHASQQLVHVPMVPCFAVQCAASGLVLHFVPLAVLRQHVTAFALLQFEWDAHFFTNPTQLLLMRAALAAVRRSPCMRDAS